MSISDSIELRLASCKISKFEANFGTKILILETTFDSAAVYVIDLG